MAGSERARHGAFMTSSQERALVAAGIAAAAAIGVLALLASIASGGGLGWGPG